jgi:uncharacterized membrane protein
VSEKHNFIVVAYESREQADEALRAVEDLARSKEIELKDAAVVVKDSSGKVMVDQTKELSVGTGAITGGVAGMLLGLAMGGPVGMALVGMAAGGGAGLLDTGIDNRRLKQLGQELAPGRAALGVLIKQANWPHARERLAPLGGEPLVVELSAEALEALEQAAAHDQAAGSEAPESESRAPESR